MLLGNQNQGAAKILVILGPTASGKSKLAMELAQKYEGEIVSCDSMQVYKRLKIGTSKPSLEDQKKIPHHLLDVLEIDQPIHAQIYSDLAHASIQSILARFKLPILCGGTMLYAQILLHGLAAIPSISAFHQEKARKFFFENGHQATLAFFQQEPALRNFPYSDPQRIIRALEVFFETGRSILDFQQEPQFSKKIYQACVLGIHPPRTELYQKINQRTEKMLAEGWVKEVEEILALGFSEEVKPLNSVGYKEILAHLSGKMTLENAKQEIQKKTRHYAKRQITWLRKFPNLHWLEPKNGSSVFELAEKKLEEFSAQNHANKSYAHNSTLNQ